jgi:hypothetical protein
MHTGTTDTKSSSQSEQVEVTLMRADLAARIERLVRGNTNEQ